MNGNSGHIKQFTQEDIRRYVQGVMTAPEMHAIEMAALEDPFLADAIEGFEETIRETGLPKVEQSRTDLQKTFEERLEKKKEKAPVIKIKWWQAAAAAIVIITAGVLGYNSFESKNSDLAMLQGDSLSNTFAKTEKTQQTTPASPADAAVLPADAAVAPAGAAVAPAGAISESQQTPRPVSDASRNPPAATAAPAPNENKEDINRPAATKSEETKAREQKVIITKADLAKNMQSAKHSASKDVTNDEALQSSNSIAAENMNAVSSDSGYNEDLVLKSPTRSRSATPVAESEKRETLSKSMARKAKRNKKIDSAQLSGKIAGISADDPDQINGQELSQNQLKNYFTGQIINSSNQPLSNATLKMVKDNLAYTTDNNGFFKIPSNDSIIEFDVTMIGQVPGRFRLMKEENTKPLVLANTDAALSEVTVTGYGIQKKQVPASNMILKVQDAEPKQGWAAFDRYLSENKNKTLSLSPAREMEVSFTVSGKNPLADFKIIRSISPAHDLEAIRLIREGPEWKLLRGKKATVNLNLSF